MARPKGFTYLMLLWWVAICGVLVTALAQSWRIEARRQREIEFLFRAEQIRAAIEAYAKVPVNAGMSRLPARLEDLLEDKRSGTLQRHLRQLWPDPITGTNEWGLVKDEKGVVGVFSNSDLTPIRAPQEVRSYRDWRFTAAAGAAPSASSTSAAVSPGASTP